MSDTSYAEIVASARAEQRVLVEVEHHGDRAVVRLRDPDKLNVLSAPLMVQLLARTGELARDREVRSIVLTGEGRAFSAGGDLRMMQNAVERFGDPADEEGATLPWQWIRHQFGALVRLIGRTDKAFIAALNGPAAGVGLAFALTCDLVVAAEDAILVPAFGKLGLVPEVGTSWALTRALGYRRAFEYYVGGKQITAEGALEPGARQPGRPRRPTDRYRDGVVRPNRRPPPARPADRQAAAARHRGPLLGAGPDDGRVRRADVLHDARLRRGCRASRGRDIERRVSPLVAVGGPRRCTFAA